MSGGVDSSVAALLLKQDGWDVVGLTMKIPYAEGCGLKRSCCGIEAAYVCRDLDIPHYYLDVREEFERCVIQPFREWYLQGRTPSPCVDCNTDLKFRLAWDFAASELGVADLATGHYATVLTDNGEAFLARASDKSRDQSYFLYGIRRDKLANLHLPLGGRTKSQVRAIARGAGLPVARRQDSMELCFAAEGDYRRVLGGYLGEPGPIVDTEGSVIGTHSGIGGFTIGQRKGIRIAAGKPLFVVDIRREDNTVVVGPRESLLAVEVYAECANILIPDMIKPGTRLFGRIRSQGEPSPCEVLFAGEVSLCVRFDEPQFAPTPGQRLVLYDCRGRVAAGGVITRKTADTEL